MSRYPARFRNRGPTIRVGTYDTQAEASAAIAGARRILQSMEELAAVELPPVLPPEPEPVAPRTSATSLALAIRGGRLDSLLEEVHQAAAERIAFLSRLPKQKGLGILAGRNEEEVRKELWAPKGQGGWSENNDRRL